MSRQFKTCVLYPGLMCQYPLVSCRTPKDGPRVQNVRTVYTPRVHELLTLYRWLQAYVQDKHPDILLDANEIRVVSLSVPQQPATSVDCGMYMMHFIQQIVLLDRANVVRFSIVYFVVYL